MSRTNRVNPIIWITFELFSNHALRSHKKRHGNKYAGLKSPPIHKNWWRNKNPFTKFIKNWDFYDLPKDCKVQYTVHGFVNTVTKAAMSVLPTRVVWMEDPARLNRTIVTVLDDKLHCISIVIYSCLWSSYNTIIFSSTYILFTIQANRQKHTTNLFELRFQHVFCKEQQQ